MHPDDDSQTTLSKWPFILGDVLLVGTALAIAVLGNWQLTDWQVGACVAAVALGAALFVLPYVVEFQVRVREEREDRAADLRVLEKHILNAEQELAGFTARVSALEDAAAEADRPDADLAAMIDQKIAPLEAARTSQKETLQALQKKLEERDKEKAPVFDPEILKPIEKRLKDLEARPKPSPEAAPEPSPAKAVESSGPSTPTKSAPARPKKTVAQIERPKRAARERHGPEEARLLQRAITEKGDNSSAAVSRIIGAKTTTPPSESLPEVKKPAPQPKSSEPAAEQPKTEKKEPEPKSETAPAEPPESAEPKPEAAPEPEAEAASPGAEGAGMLFDEAKITSPVIRTKARKNDAVVTASVFIGIGNKPFLRGSGGGLSWEKGQLMEFQEIGKWRWVAPSDLDTAVEVQIYCNDEQPDQSGKHTLAPGQKLEVSPVF
jgi:Skp family chaperone for outer membrane proteins